MTTVLRFRDVASISIRKSLIANDSVVPLGLLICIELDGISYGFRVLISCIEFVS